MWERKWEARCLGLLGMERVARAGDPLRAGGDVRGERARPDIRLEGAKAGVQGRRVRVRGADSLGRAGVGRGELGADEGHEDALCLSSACTFCEHRASVINSSYFKNLF